MNHIYKVVWSKVKNCYVVVSEIAHNSGKEHSSRTSHSHRKGSQGGLYAFALAIALGLTSPSQADAADLGNGASATYDNKDNLVVGKDSNTQLTETNGDTTTTGQPLDTNANTKLVDGEGQAHTLTKSTDVSGSIAVGYKNHNEGSNSITIGNTAKITSKPVTYYVDANGDKTTDKTKAAWYKGANGNPTKTVPQDPNQFYTVTLYQTVSNSIAVGTNVTVSGSNAVAVGNGAQASKNYSVAIGNGAQANEIGAIALGNNAIATGQGAMVIGQYNTAEGQNSLAFGGGYNDPNKGNKASSTAAVAFGEGSWAVSEGSVAFGYGTQAGNTIKDKNGKYTGQNAVAFGNGTKALGGRSLAFGENTTANYNDSVAFGNGATAYSSGAVAFGNRSRALSQYATSFGDNSVAAGSMSFAFGTDAIAGAALDDNGALELTDGSRMDSYGNKAYTTTDAAGKTTTYSIKGMGIPSGGDIHDYVVVTGTKADGTTGTYVEDYQGGIAEVKVNDDGTVTKVKDLYSGKLGGWYQYDENGKLVTNAKGTPVVTPSAKMTSIPVTMDKATPGSNGYTLNGFKNATAFGYSTEASGDNATAFGNDTKAKAAAATAFGTTTTASGVNATAFGLSTTASGDNATAFGESSEASGEAATAFGISSNASGKNSLAALGGTASAENAAAIGNGAQAKLADSVALGSGAVADRQSGAKGYDMLTKAESTNTSTAWVSKANAIAVGNGSTLTRQITGVAAGSQDTDAVNVAQLKAAGFKVTTQKNGDISSSIINGDTLDFEGKDNAIVSTTKDSKTITVAVSKTPTFDSATFGTTNNEKVTIANGQVSAFNSEQKKRAAVGVDNQGNGTLFLVNDDLSQAHLYTQSSKETGNDGITRMYYTSSTDNGGEVNGVHTIAVLDDGINYVGDNYTDDKKTNKVVVKHKLNSTMDVTGGADTSNLSNNNIGVVATPAVEDNKGNVTQRGKLEIKLNKNLNLTDKGSVQMGNTTINNGGVTITPTGVTDDNKKISLTDKGLSNGGKQITHVDSGLKDAAGNPVDLATASGDVLNNAVNVGDLKKVSSAHTTVTVNGSVEAPDAGADGKLGNYTGWIYNLSATALRQPN